MIRGLYTAISGMITQEAKQDVITNNLANANTVGFKQDNLAAKKFDDLLVQNYDKIVGGKNVKNTIGSLSFGSGIDEVKTDFTQGMIENTDKPTDFAIDGRGFFQVSRNDGVATNTYYSRDGHFHVNTAGYLVNDSGDNVLGTNVNTNNVEPINVGNGKVVVDGSGNIRVDNQLKYKFNFADVNNTKDLTKVGDNLYSAKNVIQVNANVKQNALEKSNVNVVSTMVDMMNVMRSFETNQKVVQAMDDTLGKAVNDVGSIR